MPRLPHVVLMARYNTWMNTRLYAAAATLPDDDVMRERGAFFGSIFATLNHLLVADTLWLKRFSQHPARHPALDAVRAQPQPAALNQPLAADLERLRALRVAMDATIDAWAASLRESDLDQVLHYANTRGDAFARDFFSLLMHFFNHQTHHRGQTTTLLSQAGVDMGATDLLVLIPEQATA